MDQSTLVQLSYLGKDLAAQMLEAGSILNFKAGDILIKEQQYIKLLPLILKGSVKVRSTYEESGLLLYYIHSNESCVMSFSAMMNEHTSNAEAVAETDGSVLMLPADKVRKWIRDYPSLRDLFFSQYDKRYEDMLMTVNEVLHKNIESRLRALLRSKAEIADSSEIKTTHAQLATDLGTAREVVSRLLKKMEFEGKISLQNKNIILHD